jgi:TetR/AcrR family transcriptional regulator, cholesterol catabolism regulator
MKQQLIAQSIELFEKNGFTATSIQHIVDALQVSKGTFYYYFSSKEQLLMEIHDDYISDLLDRQQVALAQSKSNREKLQAIVSLLIHDIEQYGAAGRVFFREIRHLDALHADEIRKKRDTFRKRIAQVIQNGMDSGEFREHLNADILSLAVLGITNWSYQWYQLDGELSPTKLAAIFVDFILNGLLLHLKEVEQ